MQMAASSCLDVPVIDGLSASVRHETVIRGGLFLLCCLVLFQTGPAQDFPTYVGTWKGSGGNPEASEECGASFFEGTLQIYQRVSSADANLFDGRVQQQRTTQSCDTVRDLEARVIVVVKSAEEIELHYLRPGWIPDILTRTGNTMTGEDANGSKSMWTKQPNLEIDERIEEASYNLAKKFHKEHAEHFIRELSMFQTEHANTDVEVWSVYNDSAMCVVESLRTQAVEKSLPFYELLSIIDPRVGGADIELSRALDHKALAENVESCLEEHERLLLQKRINALNQEQADVQS